MKKYIQRINIWYCIIVLLLVLHVGNYSQLVIQDNEYVIYREILFDTEIVDIVFYYVYLISTVLALAVIGVIVSLFIYRTVKKIKKYRIKE